MTSFRNTHHQDSHQGLNGLQKAIRDLVTKCVQLGHCRIAVGFSGGLDSTVLLHSLWQSLAQMADDNNPSPIELVAFHINHQISPYARDWLKHCEAFAQKLGLPFEGVNVLVERHGNLEANARLARYAALEKLCIKYQINLLVTAHHQDDQIETFFLRLLRGSGLTGLIGMADQRPLNEHPQIVLIRPLLQVPRSELESYAKLHELSFIQDESNQDEQYTRNRLRHTVIPPLLQTGPVAKTHIINTLQQLKQDEALLNDYVNRDLQKCLLDGQAIDLNALAAMDELRQMAVLRLWLKQHTLVTPNKAQLMVLLQQCLSKKHEQKMVWHLHHHVVLRYQMALYIVSSQVYDLSKNTPPHEEILWQGQTQWHLPNWGGTFVFSWDPNCPVEKLGLWGQTIQVGARQGGESYVLGPNRPARSLKQAFQTAKVPHWQRFGPILRWIGKTPDNYPIDQTVLYVAHLGQSYCPMLSQLSKEITISYKICNHL